MTCEDAHVLIHALLDGELDASHAREIENHLATCPHCKARVAAYHDMREALSACELSYTAPARLRQRIEDALPPQRVASRRTFIQGLALGSTLSALAASGLYAIILRRDDQQQLLSDIVSAHLRSLQAGHTIDVASSDQHTVKPWFNGRLDVAPPVIDLSADGFPLVGGRLDYIQARSTGVVVYRRRAHVINLFVTQGSGASTASPEMTSIHGFNIQHWNDRGFDFWAVSDVAPQDLVEFKEKFDQSLRGN